VRRIAVRLRKLASNPILVPSPVWETALFLGNAYDFHRCLQQTGGRFYFFSASSFS
jgi:hypothetical protein